MRRSCTALVPLYHAQYNGTTRHLYRRSTTVQLAAESRPLGIVEQIVDNPVQHALQSNSVAGSKVVPRPTVIKLYRCTLYSVYITHYFFPPGPTAHCLARHDRRLECSTTRGVDDGSTTRSLPTADEPAATTPSLCAAGLSTAHSWRSPDEARRQARAVTCAQDADCGFGPHPAQNHEFGQSRGPSVDGLRVVWRRGLTPDRSDRVDRWLAEIEPQALAHVDHDQLWLRSAAVSGRERG